LGFKEVVEISKPRIVVLLVITAVTSMYAASKLVPGVPDLDYWAYLHISHYCCDFNVCCK